MNWRVEYAADARPSADELLRFYERHGHPNHPTMEQVERMVRASFCLVTARVDGELIGFARGVADGMLGRLVECKLDPAYQGPAAITRRDARIEDDAYGIARQMAGRVLDALRDHGVGRVEAIAYGTEVDFCEELGFKRMSGVVALALPLGRGSTKASLAESRIDAS